MFIMPSWKLSWRLHYLWNAKNKDPIKRITGPPGGPWPDDTQAGQAIHLNFATSFEAMPKRLHVGVNGYYLKQITDTGAIEAVVDEVIANNPEQVQQFRDGKDKVLGFFVGQVMKATQGKANPGQVNQLLKSKLKQ